MPVMAMMLKGAAAGGGGTPPNGYYRSITIDHTKVGSADLTNFPVLVMGTYSYLATAANGGKVQNANGYDVGFFSDAALTTRLKHEIDLYTASSGQVAYWVKVPTVSHTSDTVIYMAYGNTSITTDQSDHVNVWDANFKAVYHLGSASTLSLADSTSSGMTLTNATGLGATTGVISGGANLNKAAGDNLYHLDNAIFQTTAAHTIEAWITPAVGTSGYRVIASHGDGVTLTFAIEIEGGGGAARTIFTQGSSNYKFVTGASALTLGNTYHIVGTYDGATVRLYQNGVSVGTPLSVTGASDAATSNRFVIGGDGSGDFYGGMVDEVRLSNVARSADWISAGYNNQSSASTFYAVGAETPA